jgi:hypothetical protein
MQCYMPLIPTTQEVEIKGLKFKSIPSQKLVRSYVNNKPGMLAYICDHSYMGNIFRRIMVQTKLGKKV